MSPEAVDFSRRAHLSEWMDEPCSYADFRACLVDLESLNRLVFAYRPIEQWLAQWLEQFTGVQAAPLHIVDVGCGGGDMLRRVEKWARKRSLSVRLTGIDLNPYAARVAREFTPPGSRIEWVTGDAFSYEPPVPIDLVISSLFTHHLPEDEIPRFLAWMERVAVRGWFINDLHRSKTSFYSFQMLAAVMRWHRFVRHDGPISFRRSFRREDWLRYLERAGVDRSGTLIYTMRPARLCVARVK